MKKIITLIIILLSCVSCTVQFRYDDTFVIKSISESDSYSRYEYLYEIKHYDINSAYYETFYFKSNEKYEIGDTIIFKLK